LLILPIAFSKWCTTVLAMILFCLERAWRWVSKLCLEKLTLACLPVGRQGEAAVSSLKPVSFF